MKIINYITSGYKCRLNRPSNFCVIPWKQIASHLYNSIDKDIVKEFFFSFCNLFYFFCNTIEVEFKLISIRNSTVRSYSSKCGCLCRARHKHANVKLIYIAHSSLTELIFILSHSPFINICFQSPFNFVCVFKLE